MKNRILNWIAHIIVSIFMIWCVTMAITLCYLFAVSFPGIFWTTVAGSSIIFSLVWALNRVDTIRQEKKDAEQV